MPFHPEGRAIPERLVTDEFVLRPVKATDAEADLDALMSSRETLRIWDQSDWPSDDFTIEENRGDLKEHEADHEAGTAFTYTVMDAAGTRCLGCVYLYPLGSILRNMGVPDEDVAGVGDFEAYVTFWVRESELAGGLERRLLEELLAWFDGEWSFQGIALGTNTEDVRQMSLFRESGFEPKWRRPIPGRDAQYLTCTAGGE